MADAKPIDLEHLDRYTGGDRGINAEILALFDGQCRTILAEMDALAGSETHSKAWQELTHKLKGAARGVGAFALGASAAEAEKAPPGCRYEIMAQLKRDSAAVHTFIEEVLNKPV